MNLPKFLDMISNNTLYFNRIDCFEDVFEGHFPDYNKKHRGEIYNTSDNMNDAFERISNIARHHSYVFCFHKNLYESAFMWKLYSGDTGVAIKSNIDRLKKALRKEEKNLYIANVEYIDYKKDFLPEGNLFYLSMFKRKSFESENELRVIYADFDDLNNLNTDKGVYIECDLEQLLEEIYISPYAPAYLVNDVKILLDKFGLGNVSVNFSDLLTMN